MTPQEHEQLHAAYRITTIGAVVNVLLAGTKGVIGVAGQSSALVADAAHSLSDLITDVITVIGLKAGRREPDASHPWGHGRIETLAAALVALALVGAAAWIGLSAVTTLIEGNSHVPSWWTLIAAAISIASKEALYRATVGVGRRARSTVIIANAWHHRSDALSSIAVLAGLAGAMIRPAWAALDSYAALAVAALIVHAALTSLWGSLKEITDTAPEQAVLDRIRAVATGVVGVLGVHDLKARTTGGFLQIEAHVEVDGTISVAAGHRIADEVEASIRTDVEGVAGVIIHIDPPTVGDVPL